MTETKRELYELMQRVRHGHFTPPAPEGLTQAEARTMVAIDEMSRCDGETRPGRVAEITHTTPSALSQTFKALEEKGLIERRRAEGDYRAVAVSLTESGKAIAREGRRLHDKHMEEALAYLGEEDARHLVRIVTKIVDFHEGLGASPDAASAAPGPSAGLEGKDAPCA